MLVYGPQFAGTGWIIGVLSLSVLANSLGVTAGNGLWAMERPQANFVADLFSLGVVIVATISLVPLLGPLGAALATLCGTSYRRRRSPVDPAADDARNRREGKARAAA